MAKERSSLYHITHICGNKDVTNIVRFKPQPFRHYLARTAGTWDNCDQNTHRRKSAGAKAPAAPGLRGSCLCGCHCCSVTAPCTKLRYLQNWPKIFLQCKLQLSRMVKDQFIIFFFKFSKVDP